MPPLPRAREKAPAMPYTPVPSSLASSVSEPPTLTERVAPPAWLEASLM